MVVKIAISFLIYLLIVLPAILVSIFVVPVMLACGWKGYTTLFGNSKWGKANTHPYLATKGFLQEFNWLVLRNPVNNLHTKLLSVTVASSTIVQGKPNIGDKTAGGFFEARSGWFWELYWVIPYNFIGRRCLRARIGWKLINSDKPAAFVFAITPLKKYSGV